MASEALPSKWLKSINNKDDPLCEVPRCEDFVLQSVWDERRSSQKSQIDQHVNSTKHKHNLKLKAKRKASQAQLEDIATSLGKKLKFYEFNKELCEVILSANIPWDKLDSPKLRSFLELKWGVSIPVKSTLTKNYLDVHVCFRDGMLQITSDLKDHMLWVGADETTAGRIVLNVVVGKLDRRVRFLRRVIPRDF